MSFPDRTGYLDPTGSATSRTPAAPVSLPTTGYVPTGPQTYAPITLPRKRRRRRHPLWTAVFALLVGMALAVPVVVLAVEHNGYHLLPHTPSAAEAKAACKSALELEAEGRLKRATEDSGDSVVPSLAGVDITEPVRTSTGYTVDGTIRFNIISFLGSLPGTVYVACDATISGSKLTTAVRNR